ncbi:MAG: GlxA family transcriptional regulator [Marmoricola sp.]
MADLTVVVLDDAFASSVATSLDTLRTAAALAPRLGAPAPRWRVASPRGGAVRIGEGLTLDTVRLPRSGDSSTWLVPGLGTESPAAVLARLEQPDARAAVAGLRRHARAGGRVAASCSAVFLLAAAGLLEGRRATTTWWLAPVLADLAPGCTVDADRMVCADGPVTTGGAAFAHTDLMLHLVRDHGGPALADAVARTLVVDAREAQAPYVVPEVLANGDALVLDLVTRIERALPDPPSVTELAAGLGISERTLSRHVHRATGRTTFALVQSVKLRRARALLAGSTLSVDQVAAAVGYQDATALRRAMRKVTGATPSRYRGG